VPIALSGCTFFCFAFRISAALDYSAHLQIEVEELGAGPNMPSSPADRQHFMFQVFRVVKKVLPEHSQDPDVTLAKALLARSRHAGPQEELWIANSIAKLKAQGELASLSQGGTVKGVQRFREVAAHVGHVAQVVTQLNKLKLRINDGVSFFAVVTKVLLSEGSRAIAFRGYFSSSNEDTGAHSHVLTARDKRSMCRVKRRITWLQNETALNFCLCTTVAWMARTVVGTLTAMIWWSTAGSCCQFLLLRIIPMLSGRNAAPTRCSGPIFHLCSMLSGRCTCSLVCVPSGAMTQSVA
jgi:hypothetical protein